jgi:OOP family OmpA-OmpF porin
MKKNGWLVLAGVLAAAAAGPAMAHEPGLYLGGAAGVTQYQESCGPGAEVTVPCDDNDEGWRLFAGYQVNSWFAVEGGYADLGTLRAQGGTFTQDTESTGFDLVGVFSWQVVNRLYLFGKLGAYRVRVTSDISDAGATEHRGETSAGFAYGLGAEYTLGPIGVRGEFVRYDNAGGQRVGLDNIIFYNASLLWRF